MYSFLVCYFLTLFKLIGERPVLAEPIVDEFDFVSCYHLPQKVSFLTAAGHTFIKKTPSPEHPI
jgi:hypothetical protein